MTALPARRPVDTATLEVVIPVYNEEHDLGPSVLRVREHLASLPWPARITIADNASTDGTAIIARRLAHEYDDVGVVHLAEKGRGRALKRVWAASEADVLVYMDVDLSTDLNALLPLVAPLLSGHSDLAIGTRLRHDSRVERGPRREVISRGYNLLVRGTLRTRFSDAQCGFKAIRADVAREVLPLVRDDAWFFDTELLVLAERAGLRIHEVPVDWVDDPDSRVDLWRTARDDLRGLARLGRGMVTGRLSVGEVGVRLGRVSDAAGQGRLGLQVAMFALVGLASTLAYAVLYLLLRGVVAPLTANLLALLLTTVGNTAANRRLTFGVRGRADRLRHQARGLLVFGLGLGVTSGALWLLEATGRTGRATEVLVLTAANLLVTLMRFTAMRAWVFSGRLRLGRVVTRAGVAGPAGDWQRRGMATQDHGPSVKDDELYEKLREDGASKEKAARIANAAADEGRATVGARGGEGTDYADRTVEELRERAAELEIEGRSEMTKDELIDALRNH